MKISTPLDCPAAGRGARPQRHCRDAAPGIASVNANVRSGPGTGYRVVDTLTKGEYVIVKDCGYAWCTISHIGNDGFVARTLLYNPYYGSKSLLPVCAETPSAGPRL